MVFAAPSAMWLYCTGTVFGGKARLLTTQKERGSEEKKADREIRKALKEKNEVESLERKEKMERQRKMSKP